MSITPSAIIATDPRWVGEQETFGYTYNVKADSWFRTFHLKINRTVCLIYEILQWAVFPHLVITFTFAWFLAQSTPFFLGGAALMYAYYSNMLPQRTRREADEIIVARDVHLLYKHVKRYAKKTGDKSVEGNGNHEKEPKVKEMADCFYSSKGETAGETAEWLNTLLDRFWPDMLEPMINDIVKNNVQYYLDLYRPAITSKLEMDTFELGSKALHVTNVTSCMLRGMKVPLRGENIPWDKVWDQEDAPIDTTAIQLTMDVSCKLKVICELYVGLIASPDLKIQAKGLDFSGKLILQLVDVTDGAIGGLRISFAELPTLTIGKLVPLGLGLVPFGNLSKLDFIKTTIDNILLDLMVRKSIDVDMKAVPPPAQKQIRVDVQVHSGSHLTAKDSRMSLRGRKYSSDPFVSLAIGGQSRKTKVVKNSLSPQWGDAFTFLFKEETWEKMAARPIQLLMKVTDEDTMMKDDPMGDANIELRKLMGKAAEGWVDLNNARSGRIRLTVKVFKYQTGTKAPLDELEAMDMMDVLGDDVVTIKGTIQSAKNLKAMNRMSGNSDPMVKLRFHGKEKETRSVTNQLNPVYNEDFYFVVPRDIFDAQPVMEIKVSDLEKIGLNKPMGKGSVDMSKFKGGGAEESAIEVTLDTKGSVQLLLTVDHPDAIGTAQASGRREIDLSSPIAGTPKKLRSERSTMKNHSAIFDEVEVEVVIQRVTWQYGKPVTPMQKTAHRIRTINSSISGNESPGSSPRKQERTGDQFIEMKGFRGLGRVTTNPVAAPYEWKETFRTTINVSDLEEISSLQFHVMEKGTLFGSDLLGDAFLDVGKMMDDVEEPGVTQREVQLELQNLATGLASGFLDLSFVLTTRRRKQVDAHELQTGALKVKISQFFNLNSSVKLCFVVLQPRALNYFLIGDGVDPHLVTMDSLEDVTSAGVSFLSPYKSQTKTRRLGTFPLDISTEVKTYVTKQTSVGRFGIKITTRGETLKIGADTALLQTQWVNALNKQIQDVFETV